MRRRSSAWRDSIGLTYYPSFGFEPLPEPVGERAIDQRGVRIALWRRTLVRLRIGAIATAVGLAGVAAAGISGSWNAYTAVPILAASALLLGCAASAARIAVLWRRLTRAPWTVYECQSIRMPDGFPISMVLVDRESGSTFWVKIRQSRRSEVMRGMTRPEVWLAHYTSRRGILTVAGGGEMFVARTVRNPPVAPRILPQRSPGSPHHRLNPYDLAGGGQLPEDVARHRRNAALDDAKRQRLRAQREARRAKRAAEEARQRILPRIRGARRLPFK